MIPQYGWKCPECGAIMAPWQNTCVNCQGKNSLQITCDKINGIDWSKGWQSGDWITTTTASPNITLTNTSSTSNTIPTTSTITLNANSLKDNPINIKTQLKSKLSNTLNV